jgi:hypothetical protein
MTTAGALAHEEPVRGAMVLLPVPPPGGFTAGETQGTQPVTLFVRSREQSHSLRRPAIP